MQLRSTRIFCLDFCRILFLLFVDKVLFIETSANLNQNHYPTIQQQLPQANKYQLNTNNLFIPNNNHNPQYNIRQILINSKLSSNLDKKLDKTTRGRCERSNLCHIFTNPRRFLSDSSFIRLQNFLSSKSGILSSSLLATSIPMFIYLMPSTNNDKNTTFISRRKLNLKNNYQLLNYITNNTDSQNNKTKLYSVTTKWLSKPQGHFESLVGIIERSIQELPNFPSLHPQECLKRAICEAHRQPERFGSVGLGLRVLFPSSLDQTTNEHHEYKALNKYKHAASLGSQSKQISKTNNININNSNNIDTIHSGTFVNANACEDRYEDCALNPLELAHTLASFAQTFTQTH